MDTSSIQAINRRWQLNYELGQGTYGTVYAALDKQTGNTVAVKIARQNRSMMQSLLREARVYQVLNSFYGPHPGFLAYHHSEQISADAFVLVMDKGERDLAEVFLSRLARTGENFSLETVSRIGIQILLWLRDLHQVGFLHGDIKPNNMLYSEETGRVKLIDFGCSENLVGGEDNLPRNSRVPRTQRKVTVFSSIARHNGEALGMKDDLEALGYVLSSLFHGNLPWSILPMGLHKLFGTNAEWYWKWYKERIDPRNLCKGMGNGFVRYFQHLRGLRKFDEPDYNHLIRCLGSYMTDDLENGHSRRRQQQRKRFSWRRRQN